MAYSNSELQRSKDGKIKHDNDIHYCDCLFENTCASDISTNSNETTLIFHGNTLVICFTLSCTALWFGIIGNSLSFVVLHKCTSWNIDIYLRQLRTL